MIEVEEVVGRRDWRRFLDLPVHLHRGSPGWLPPLATLDRFVLDTQLNPVLRDAELSEAYFARRAGKVVGRIAVHVVDGHATWSHLEVPAAADDPDGRVLTALCDVARRRASEAGGAGALVGPLVGGDPAQVGVRVDHCEVRAGLTLPWNPPDLVDRLVDRGGALVDAARRARVPLASSSTSQPPENGDGHPLPDVPPPYRAWRDDRLRLAGPWGTALAVPDVVEALAPTGVRSAWSAARRARRGDWRSCAAVRIEGSSAVAHLEVAAIAAGYQEIIRPWTARDPGEAVAFTRVSFAL